MDDSGALQMACRASSGHTLDSTRGRKTEKKREAPRQECAEKHEDTINEVKKGTARVSESCVQFLGWYPPVLGLVAPFKVSHPSQLQV